METTVMKVSGMTCMGCVNSVKKVLHAIDGVHSAEVSLEPAQATVVYDARAPGPRSSGARSRRPALKRRDRGDEAKKSCSRTSRRC